MSTLGETPRTDRRDKRVINLAAEISDARDRRIPVLLLGLRDILNSAESGTEDTKRIKQDIYTFNILQTLILVLRQDFSVIDGDWTTAATLAKLLSVSCTGVELKKEDSNGFYNDLLPKACENLFLLSRHIQAYYTNIPETDLSEIEEVKTMENFQTVMDALAYLVAAYSQLCQNVYTSPWLLQLLISDEPDTVGSVMSLLMKIFRINGYLLNKLDDNTVFTIMDELIYKLTVNNIIEVAAIATRCVLKICDYHKGMVGALSTRYKGLRPLLGKWSGQGFDRDLKHILTLLDTGSIQRAEGERDYDAAMVIQMMWRGFSTRKRLKRADQAFAKFQKKYRLKKKHVTMKKEEMKLAKEFERQLRENRRKIMREFHQRQLNTIEILPAAKVVEYLSKEKSFAAMKIQTFWRGKRERDLLPVRREVRAQVKAAIKIQRFLRKWLDKKAEKNRDISISLRPPGLTDARRVELQRQIIEWREIHPTHVKDRPALLPVHTEAARLLHNHYTTLRKQKQQQQHIEALMLRLDTDSELVQLAPNVKDVTEKDVEMYISRSVPIATKAKLNHHEMIRKLQKPWWKRLDEDDDDEYRPEYQDDDHILF